MELDKAKAKAIELMDKHGLLDLGWYFEFDNAKKRFGQCDSNRRRISLSKYLVGLNEEWRVTNTILHEIAHGLVGCRHGHDSIWRRKALEIGCDGNRCYSSKFVSTPQSKYIAKCTGCNTEFKRHKKIKEGRKSSCGKCSHGRYNELYVLEWKLNDKKLG